MTKDRKIIVLVCIILVISIISIGVIPKIVKKINAKKEYLEHEIYSVQNKEPLDYKKEEFRIVEEYYSYESFLEIRNIKLDEEDLEEIKEKDFDNFNYLLILIPYNSCGEKINYNGADIDEEERNIKIELTLKETCGVCAPEYSLYEIKLPKSINDYDYSIEIDWDKEDVHCNPVVAYKPILYLYPEKQTNIKVNFANEDNLTTTYPKFNQEWDIVANPNGDLYDNNNNYYYALYWEEKDYSKIDLSEGFYVSKENSINFLEEKLSILGLNNKEKNEFIMYWLPILEKNQHNLVYFELTNELQNKNELIITPKPNTLIRIRMHVKKVPNETNIKEQQLVKQERIGYTAIEWGGVIHN